jgi:CubicO group peptidase (beta-lactamase class C family)
MSLIALPPQPVDVVWPTLDWPEGELSVARAHALAPYLAEAFGEVSSPVLGETHALLIIQGGRLIFEQYGEGHGPDSTFPSWSKAKSITHALTGILVGDGRLDIHAPADAPEWQQPGDPRQAISLDHLLRMSSGLKFVEDYAPGSTSDVLEMLYGSGKSDTAAYAAGQPLIHPPGTVWSYASGTTNIISRALSRSLNAYGPDFEAFMRQRLFEPLGMTSPIPKFDAAGTFIGSSFCFCSARDFARFGLLYLRNGTWEGRQLLPVGWVDYARTRTAQPPTELDAYGAQWWLGFGGPNSFSANGYDGQFTFVLPDLDMIIVRSGKTGQDIMDNLKIWMRNLANAMRTA